MLPAALNRAIRLPLLDSGLFTPTKWDDAAAKAKFANHLLRFIAEDFPEHLFIQKFYERLSNAFGHNACYNRHGFWSEFFMTRATKIDFLDQTIRHPCYGDPAWTYSDVEQVIRARLRGSGVIDWHQRLLAQETEARERAEYERLSRTFAPKSTDADQANPAQPARSAHPARSGFQAEITPAERTSVQSQARSAVHGPLAAPIAQPDLFAGL